MIDAAAGADFRIVPAGDSALMVEFEARIDPEINARAIAAAETIREAALPGVRDLVPTYRSVMVYFDPLRTSADVLVDLMTRAATSGRAAASDRIEPVEVPVCYGGTFGPDLAGVAEAKGLTEPQVVELHSEPIYRVFMLGFVPGFGYMGLVNPRLDMLRHSTPRTRVPTGSVAIAGRQTGVYPADTPGGWHILGRTPLKPFDPTRSDPFLYKPGDRVRFHPIDPATYARLAAHPNR